MRLLLFFGRVDCFSSPVRLRPVTHLPREDFMSQMPPPVPPLQYATPEPARNDLREIAIRQKAIMYCILGEFVLLFAQFLVPAPFRPIMLLLFFGASITASVFVFMLAIAVYNTGVGIVLGILTLVPLVGFIVLLVVNGTATRILRSHGIKVGLMGANSSQIPSRI